MWEVFYFLAGKMTQSLENTLYVYNKKILKFLLRDAISYRALLHNL